MLKNYIITALRNLWRNKFFSVINVLGVSVGIACCMLIFLYAHDESSFDSFNKNKENIYHITSDLINKKGEVNRMGETGRRPGPAFKKHIPEVLDFARLQEDYVTVKNKDEALEQEIFWADASLFSIFTMPFIYGNAKTALNDMHSVVLTENMATKYFGRTNVVGQSLQINTGEQFETFVVSGVAKNSPQNSSVKIQMVLPMKLQEKLNPDSNWINFYLNTFVTLAPGANVKTVEQKMAGVYSVEAASDLHEMAARFGYQDSTAYHLQPLLKLHLSTDYLANNGLTESGNPMYSYILIGIAAFILLIACINFVNLTVARSLKRAREIGIRKAIGGERKQLIMQFLGESFVLSLFAFALAAILAQLALPFFNSVTGKELAFSYLLDAKLIFGYIGLFLLTGLLAGFYPALVLSAFRPVETLYGRLRFGGKNYLSKGLVVFQFTLSTFLIIATITIYRQFGFLTHFDLGYDNTNVVTLKTGKLKRHDLELFKNELYKDPHIQNVSADQGGSHYTLAHINGESELEFNFVHLDEDYFSLFKVPVIQGRNFSKTMTSDTAESAVVNEAFAKAAGWKNPLGQIVDFFYSKKKYHVIGVVKDHHFALPISKVTPQMFVTDAGRSYQRLYARISPTGKASALHHIEKTFKRLYPERPYQYSFKDDNLAESYATENKWKQVIGFASMLTIFISCIGLFGLTALSAEKRAKEVSIRKVLGASVASVVQKLSADFIRLVLIASLIALPAAWWTMHKWLDNYPYHIELKLMLFGYAVLAVVLIAMLTISYHAVKAAIANPVKSLRNDS